MNRVSDPIPIAPGKRSGTTPEILQESDDGEARLHGEAPFQESPALIEGPNQDLTVRECLRIREEQEAREPMEAEAGPRLGQVGNQ